MIKLDVLSKTMKHSIKTLEQTKIERLSQLEELEKEAREKFLFDYRMDLFQVMTGSIFLKRRSIRPFSVFGKGYAFATMLCWAFFDSSVPFGIAFAGSLFIFLFFQTLDQLNLNFQVATALCWRMQNEKESLNQWKQETFHLLVKTLVVMELFVLWVGAMYHLTATSPLKTVFLITPTAIVLLFQFQFLKFWLKREKLYHFSSAFYFGLLNKEDQAMELLFRLLKGTKL